MNNFFDIILSSIDFVVVAIVLCSGFFQTRYLSVWTWSKDPKHDSALKTLVVSFLASVVYIVLIKDPEKGSNWAKYFLSYFFATSLYELLVKPFYTWISSKLGN